MNSQHKAREALKCFALKTTPVYRAGKLKPVGTVGDFMPRQTVAKDPSVCAHGADSRTCYGCLRERLARQPICRF
jgi:hypothetical protein